MTFKTCVYNFGEYDGRVSSWSRTLFSSDNLFETQDTSFSINLKTSEHFCLKTTCRQNITAKSTQL